MIRSLWSGATGMIAQQTNLDVVSNNLANVNTSGYKKVRRTSRISCTRSTGNPGLRWNPLP